MAKNENEIKIKVIEQPLSKRSTKMVNQKNGKTKRASFCGKVFGLFRKREKEKLK